MQIHNPFSRANRTRVLLLYFTNAVGNFASRKVKEKSGATYIEARPAKFVSLEFTQVELWELTKENWIILSKQKIFLNDPQND